MASQVEPHGVEERIEASLMRHGRARTLAAVVMAICGGLAVLYLFLVLIASVNVARAVTATVVALAFAAVWLIGYWYRARTGATFVQRRDRERRGF